MVERRGFPRVPVSCPVQIRHIAACADPAAIRNSFVRNLSRVGIELISFDFYPIDGRVKLQLVSERNMPLMDVLGRIVWVQQLPYQEKFRVGVQFLQVSGVEVNRNVIIDEAQFEQVIAGVEVPYAN